MNTSSSVEKYGDSMNTHTTSQQLIQCLFAHTNNTQILFNSTKEIDCPMKTG